MCATLCPLRLCVHTEHGVCGLDLEVTGHTYLFKYRKSAYLHATSLFLPPLATRERPSGCPPAVQGAGGVYAGAARGPRREAEGRCYNSRLQHCLSSLSLSRAVADSALRSTCSRYGTNERRARTIQSTQTSTRRVKNPVTRLGTRVRRGACFLPPPSACLRA